MASPATLRRIALGTVIATIALTGTAFWLSYEHLHDVARHYGLDGSRAWAWPATVDLFIVIGEALILSASLQRLTDRAAIVLAVIGSTGSIALNVAGVGSHAPGMTYVVAAVPPCAALLAFGALMRQIHENLSGGSRAETGSGSSAPASAPPEPASRAAASAPATPATPPAATPGRTVPEPGAAPAGTPASPRPATPGKAPAAAAGTSDSTLAAASEARDLDEVADTYRKLAAALGRAPSDKALADALGVGRSRAQQLRSAAAEAGHADLAKALRAAS
nr:DUF2637 domain-containing protein [Streptacidiphilus carbonis]